MKEGRLILPHSLQGIVRPAGEVMAAREAHLLVNQEGRDGVKSTARLYL